MVDKLNRYFVPLYVENDEAERILRAGGKEPYAEDQWQLVQTHLILKSGQIQELWRPGTDTGPNDALRLAAVLDVTISALGLSPGEPLPAYHNPRFDTVGEGGLLLRTVARFPLQENLQRKRTFAIDWITLDAADVAGLLPPAGAGTAPYPISEDLATAVLIHLRPPLDTAQDLDETALKIVHAAGMRGRVLGERDGLTVVGLAGALSLVRPLWMGPPERLDDKWRALKQAHLKVQGFLLMDPHTRQVVDLQLETTEASLVPPDGRPVVYEATARITRDAGYVAASPW